MSVQGLSAALAGGVSVLITMPLDTIKIRLQVLDSDENGNKRPTFVQTVRNLMKEGGWVACCKRTRSEVCFHVHVCNHNDHDIRILETYVNEEPRSILTCKQQKE